MTDKTADWPKYQSHKIVRAAKIVAVHDDGDGVTFLWVDPGTGNLEKFIPTEAAMLARAQVGGYAVVYDDNDFRSVTPKAPFEEGYTALEEVG